MWPMIIGFLLQILLEFIKKWIAKDDQETAFADLSRAHDESVKTGSSKPLRDLLAKWKAKRQAKG